MLAIGRDYRVATRAHGYPLCQVLQTPAHYAMDCGDRPVLDDPCKRSALLVVELGRRARCLAVNQPVRPIGIETQHPIPDHLQARHRSSSVSVSRAALVCLALAES